MFVDKKVSKKELEKFINLQIKNKKVICVQCRYTMGEYNINTAATVQKLKVSQIKLNLLDKVIHILKFIPNIQLIGLTGSLAMSNAKEEDDIDIFIITRSNRLWVTRLLMLAVMQCLGLRRKRSMVKAKNKICLNLFFDEQNMSVPAIKKTIYGAHEVLQMKPLVNRNNSYENFLASNLWVYDFFPNALKKSIIKYKSNTKSIIFFKNKGSRWGNLVEQMAKKFQLHFINKHQTTELVTDTQLWFFPYDYEQKVREGMKEVIEKRKGYK